MFIKVVLLLLFVSPTSHAKLITTSLKIDMTRPFEGEPLKLKGYKKEFQDRLKMIQDKKYAKCINDKKTPKETPDRMRVWWSYMVLKCARKVYKVKSGLRKYIKTHIEEMNQYQGDTSYLADDIGRLLVSLASSKSYIISDFEKDFLQKIEPQLKPVEKAKLYSFLGARSEQADDPQKAAEYYFRAFDMDQQPMYATRLKTLLNKKDELVSTYKDFFDNFGKSKEQVERENYNAFYYTPGSFSKLRKGVQLLNKYESSKYKVVSRIYRIVKNRIKPGSKNKWVREIKKCHVACINRLAKRYYQAHSYPMSAFIAGLAYEKQENAEAKLVAGMSTLQQGLYEQAESHLKVAVEKSEPNTKVYFEAKFRLGLLYYRLKKYDQAKLTLDNLEAHKEINDFNLQTTYWLWRSLQKLGDDKSKVVRNRLIKLYPLTYYGLLANYEKNNEKLILPTNIHVFQKNMNWDKEQILSWENFNDFLQMNFFDLARKELKPLFNVQNDQEAVLFSHFSSLAADHYSAIKTMNIIWDKNPYVNFTKNTTKLTLPVEYDSMVNEFADKYSIERNLIRSLIKQESSYRLRAVSSSNAKGLMQIVPITIKDSARYLKISNSYAKSQIYDPNMNIRLGSSYLNRMINAFKGHVPLALAAYNAGIGNIRRWIKKRPNDLSGLEELGSSQIEHEIWIDELPWAETSFYVKAILRNLILYRFYYEGVRTIPKPVWQLDTPVTASTF